ncbi:MAG: M23 family metallopeptidase [Sphingomonas sp.]
MWIRGAALIALALTTGCTMVPPMAQRASAEPPSAPYRDTWSPPASAHVAPPTAWQARPVLADAIEVAATTYIVRQGDTLRLIAERTGAGSEAIARPNNLAPPYSVRPGQRLFIPGGRYHTVHEGETGIAIARAYAVRWSRIIAANALSEPYVLRTGLRLLIPAVDDRSESGGDRVQVDLDDIVTGTRPALALADRAEPAAAPHRSGALPGEMPSSLRPPASLQWPLKGMVVTRFGPGRSGERSTGIKIATPIGTPVMAAADGVVAYVGRDVPSLGGLVILRHGGTWTSVYGHAGQLLVRPGQTVRQGEMIALSGNSGRADRPELHFELRDGRSPVDPLTRLPHR